MIETIKETLKDSFNLRIDIATPEQIQEDIEAGAKVKGTNMCILILAILIASIGLNMNSTAVIIGAMLISPLMGGIMAIGYGIAVNDLSASKRAAIGLALQVVICIITSTIYFSLSPISSAHSEILARTSPSVWDVLIAFFGGLAGIIGITRKEHSNVIPGVAIATALMPPLCTAGFGIATHNFRYFIGAMYLFFINSFFICVATVIILKVIKLPCKKFIDNESKKKLYSKMTILAIITIIPSIFLAYQLISDTILNNNIKQFMQNEINYSDTQIVQSNIDKEENVIEIALLGQQLNSHEINRLQDTLEEYGLEKMKLKITQPNMEGVLTAEDLDAYMDSNNKENESKMQIALKDNEIAQLKEKLDKSEKELSEYKKHDYNVAQISSELQALYPQIKEVSVGIQHDGVSADGAITDKKTLLVILESTSKISDSDKAKIENWFKTKTGETDITMTVQIVK